MHQCTSDLDLAPSLRPGSLHAIDPAQSTVMTALEQAHQLMTSLSPPVHPSIKALGKRRQASPSPAAEPASPAPSVSNSSAAGSPMVAVKEREKRVTRSSLGPADREGSSGGANDGELSLCWCPAETLADLVAALASPLYLPADTPILQIGRAHV